MASRQKWGVARSVATLAASLGAICFVALRLHYELPYAVEHEVNPNTGLAQISEKTILANVYHLSEVIGYRTVGTREHAAADQWMVERAQELAQECTQIVKATGGQRHLECEVFRQEGNGTHRFDMMDKRVYKTYHKLSNIIFRLSNGTDASKADAMLINAHLDSTLPSPGAADDALPVAIMMDCIRVLINTPDWTPQNALVFLWNNAEESLQDASHLFATQSELASTCDIPGFSQLVDGLIATSSVSEPSSTLKFSFKAAGTTGPEILFQATSEEMIKAYSYVPRPYGTVVANDVFKSGIILSDTDFRQFEQYQNLTGLDMAVVGDSYLYHTRKDIIANIQPGVAQHMGENVLALLLYLSSSESPVSNLKTFTPPQTVYFSVLGRLFILFSFSTARKMYNAGFFISIALVLLPTANAARRVGAKVHAVALASVLGGLVASIVSSNLVALVMTQVLHKGMSWFSREWYCLILYGLPGFAGLLAFQLLMSKTLSPTSLTHLEPTIIATLHILFSTLSVVLQYFGLGSAVLFFVWSTTSLPALALSRWKGVSLAVYIIGQIMPCAFGMELVASLLDIFVPLTGRMGADAPADHIIATISGALVFLVFPFTIPLAHRFGRQAMRMSVLVLCALSVVSVVVFAGFMNPFDALHPTRVYVLHTENTTTGEFSLHVSSSDSAPGLVSLVQDIADTFGVAGQTPHPIRMDEWNPDWDMLYPFSQFLTPYKLAIDTPASYVSAWKGADAFRVTTSSDSWDEALGIRTLTLVIDHPGIIWTVIAFDAHVLAWTLDDAPPDHYTRHHVKEASFYGVDTYSLDLVIKVNGPEDQLNVNFIGIQEKGMWPGKVAERQGPAMDLFEQLDPWFEARAGGAIDALLMGCVAGVASI